jgi:YVTN family beta-propeller protein
MRFRSSIIAAALLFCGSVAAQVQYLSPGELALTPDGSRLLVVCERSDELRVVDVHTSRVVKTIRVGHVPRGVTVSTNGHQIFVANSWADSVSVIDAQKLEVIRTISVGFEPISVAVDHAATTLYTANRLSNDISVVDLQTGQGKKRLLAGRGASYFAASADGRQLISTHIYPNPGPHRAQPESEITVVDVARQVVTSRQPMRNIAGVFHVALSPDGRLGVAAQLRPKNLVPLAHVEHGSVFGNALTVFGQDVGKSIEVPIDELDRYFVLPFGVAITPNKSKIYVSTAGSDSVTVIDVPRLLGFSRAHRKPFANDLSASAHYVKTRIAVGRNPRGVVISADGRMLFVANRMDDTVSVIDVRTDRVISTIDLGGPREITALRKGERIFNTARYGFQGHFGCANCHLDFSFDGLTWDLEPDGFGKDIVDNRLLEDLMGTEPFKWNGGNPDMPTECGPRTEKYFYRSQSYAPAELVDLVTYVMAQPFRPNRFRKANGELTAAQERGKDIFDRIKDKQGNPIPEGNQCGYCHSGPKYTNQKSFDVGTGKPTDRSPLVDVPQLNNVFMTAPYLHDGSARSMEEIWTIFNPNDKHGRTNDLQKDELNDLIEYLRTL